MDHKLRLPGHPEVEVTYSWTPAGPEDIYLDLGTVHVDDLDGLGLPCESEIWSAVQADWDSVYEMRQVVA